MGQLSNQLSLTGQGYIIFFSTERQPEKDGFNYLIDMRKKCFPDDGDKQKPYIR